MACVNFSDKGSCHQAWDPNSQEHSEFSGWVVSVECHEDYIYLKPFDASPAGIGNKQKLSALRTRGVRFCLRFLREPPCKCLLRGLWAVLFTDYPD